MDTQKNTSGRRLVVVTGASSGIGYELAKVGQSKKDDPAMVAKAGILAEQHRKMAEPGSGEKR